MQKYSLGIQSFLELRRNNCVYVDKTEKIYQLIGDKAYFLSHPRRFGKSLLLSTLKYLFQGRKELFTGLWIEDKVDWTTLGHPVLHFSFIESSFHSIGFEKYLHIKIDEQAELHAVSLQNTDISNKIRELITKISQKHQKGVVFLVDEYDKPINEFLRKDQIPTAEAN
ncbi:MAG: AAA family ATPase, partial [Cytophagales bacterium]